MSRPTRARIIIRSAGQIEYRINLIDYGATWKYQIGAHDHDSGFEAPAFDDSAWPSGPAAFGVVNDGEQTGGWWMSPCVQNRDLIGTAWAVETDLCVRKTVTIPTNATRVYFEFGIDNIGTIYLDGVEVQAVSNIGCQSRGSQSFWLDDPPTGDVVVAVRARDPSDLPSSGLNETFFDLKLDVVGPTAPVYGAGVNPLLYRTINTGQTGTGIVGGCGTFEPNQPVYVTDGSTITLYSEICNGVTDTGGLKTGFWTADLGAAYILSESTVWNDNGGAASGSGSGRIYMYGSNTGEGGPWTLLASFGFWGDSDPIFHTQPIVDATPYRYVMLEWSWNAAGGIQFYTGMHLTEWQITGTPADASELGFTPITGRGPGAIVAQIEDFQAGGVSKFHNAAGELFFTLKNDHPQIGEILPWQTHWTFEVFRGEGWTQINEGWITDYDSTDQETIFYGLDYLGVLSLLYDERFNPEQAPDAAALLYPDDSAGTGGSKYVEEAIHDIVADQIDRAIYSGNSELGFFTRGAVATMDETVTIFCTLKERLAFIAGLIDSHRAGTGKKTRLQSVMTRTWIDERAWTPSYSFQVLDDPGDDRTDLRFEYGQLVQGYRVIPFGDFATRVLGIGKTSTGFRLEFHIEPAPPPTGEDANYAELRWGRLNRVNFWEDIVDLNDLRRRSRQLAGQVGAIGKKVGIGVRVDTLGIEDGWDICDSVPVVIQRGPLDTTTMGGDGLWTIWGWAAIFQNNGYSETVLTLLPKDPSQELPADWGTASVPAAPGTFETHDTDPDTTVSPAGPGTWINTETGHVWTVDPETGLWVDQTEAGNFSAIGPVDPVPFDHGNMGAAETLDYDDGSWHRGNLDVACAITVAGFDVDKGQVMVVELTGTGAITWDADVDFGGGDDQPNASGDTVFLLMSSVGSTAIRGAKFGGSPFAEPAIVLGTVAAEGTAATGIRSDATIVAFDDADPLVDGAVDPGVAPFAARSDHVHPAAEVVTVGGPLLITDVPAGSPLVFDDLIQNEEGTDLMYADSW